MTSNDDLVQLLAEFESDPPFSVVERVLNAAQDLDEVRRLLGTLDIHSHLWAVRLVAMTVVEAAQKEHNAGDLQKLAPQVFDLADLVSRLDDPTAMQTCLTAMMSLGEDEALVPRHDGDRRAAQNLIWRCISSQDANTRSGALQFFESLSQFGRPMDLLGRAGLEGLRGEANRLLPTSSEEQERDLSTFIQLLDSQIT